MLWVGPVEPSWAETAVVLAAFAAYIAWDALTSLVVDVLAYGDRLRELVGPASWVYLVDLMLAPAGFAAAIAAHGSPFAAAAFLLPLFALLATFAGERRERIDKALELSQAYRGTAMLLGDVVEADDAYTGSHSRDVVELAVDVGRRMGLSSTQLRNLEFAALLHDVGKIAVPNEIINKPGKLDADEWAIIKRHTIDGQRMLEGVGGVLADVGGIVRASHEDYDGTGYPDGLAGEAIPIEARICSACDAFSAMTTDRAYRNAMSPEVAIDELQRCSGTQFDPVVVLRLVEVLKADCVERVGTKAPTRLTSDATR
jgi:HD-GYP domain-containing protein (c-di-GMP phosphodiesterase class II)